MSDLGGKSATGGMATGEGQTTKIYTDGVGPKDQTILCSLMCSCKDEPKIGAKGQRLQQVCVSQKLAERDRRSGGANVYKAEVNYNMTAQPVPTPIMRSANQLEPHRYLPGWIDKYWPGGLDNYEPGAGNVRRPDVVIVKDPTQPPTQDNLRAVVEMKFPGDPYSALHQMQDRQIAGPTGSVMLLTVDQCGCDKKKQNSSETTTESAKSSQWNPLDELDPLASKSRGIFDGLPRFGTPGAIPPPANSAPL